MKKFIFIFISLLFSNLVALNVQFKNETSSKVVINVTYDLSGLSTAQKQNTSKSKQITLNKNETSQDLDAQRITKIDYVIDSKNETIPLEKIEENPDYAGTTLIGIKKNLFGKVSTSYIYMNKLGIVSSGKTPVTKKLNPYDVMGIKRNASALEVFKLNKGYTKDQLDKANTKLLELYREENFGDPNIKAVIPEIQRIINKAFIELADKLSKK